MAGKFFPGTIPWSAMDGDYSLSADGETITGSGEIRSPWINAGTLARVQWEGSGTFSSVMMRSSLAAPDSRDDVSPVMPGTSDWDASEKYDPGLGTYPSSQGWTDAVTGESIVSGMLRVPTSGSSNWYRRYADGLFLPSKHIIIQARMSYVSGTGDQGIFARVPMGTGTYTGQCQAYCSIDNSGNIKNSGTTVYTIAGFAAGTKYDLRLEFRTASSGTRPAYYEVWLREAGSYSEDDPSGFALVAQPATSTANDYTELRFGGVWSGGATFDWGQVRLYSAPSSCDQYGWETVTDGDTSFTALDRGYVQIKGTLSGDLTGLDLQNSLSAPSNVSSATAEATGTGAVSAVASAVSGAGAYEFTLKDDGGVTIDSELTWNRAWTFVGVDDGDYTVEVKACSSDGVRSASAAASNVVTLPEATATGPTIGTAPSFTSGVLMFNKPTAGTNSLATYRILHADDPQGPYTVAQSTAWGSITWDSSNQVSATTLGLTVSNTKWYRDRIVDNANLTAEGQTAVYGGDPNSRECLVSFDFGAELASSTVSYYYSHPMTVRGGSYAKASGQVTLNGSGVGSVSLPRTEVATCSDGDSGRPFVTFIAPGYSSAPMYRTIPDAAAATFSSLDEP